MAVSVPTPSQLCDIAAEVGLDLSDADVAERTPTMPGM